MLKFEFDSDKSNSLIIINFFISFLSFIWFCNFVISDSSICFSRSFIWDFKEGIFCSFKFLISNNKLLKYDWFFDLYVSVKLIWLDKEVCFSS